MDFFYASDYTASLASYTYTSLFYLPLFAPEAGSPPYSSKISSRGSRLTEATETSRV